MKNQYFGDINDFRKYGLLRTILHSQKPRFCMMVAWMLTADDGRPDGRFTNYLHDPEKWRQYDPVLLNGISKLMSPKRSRSVSLIEKTKLLGKSEYYSDMTPDDKGERAKWFKKLKNMSRKCDFVFLDPDNGIEISSKPCGRKNSSKYIYWNEVKELWSLKKSLLIYQHFIREERVGFISCLLQQLMKELPKSKVVAFKTSNVVFLLALQPEHRGNYDSIVNSVRRQWQNQIVPFGCIEQTGQ